MIQFKRSVRLRVFALLALAVIIITVIYSSMAVVVAYVVEDESIEKLVRLEARYIESQLKTQNKIVSPRLDFMALYLNFEDAPPEIAASLSASPSRAEVFTRDNKHYHIQHLYLGEQHKAVLVAEVSQLLTVTNASKSIVLAFISVFTMALLIGVWIAFRIAKRVTQPIITLAKEVEEKQLFKPNAIDKVKRLEDEITYLKSTINRAFDALEKTLVREKDFNRDLSHELRTPLTIMKNTLQLAQSRPVSMNDQASLSQSLQSIEHIVSALLALARAESFISQGIQLRALIEESALPILERYSENDFKLNIDVDDAIEISANRELMKLLISNLIENAFLHASTDRLDIQFTESVGVSVLKFENTIHAPITGDLTRFGEKSMHSEGLGLGLYLIKRITESLNMAYTIESDEACYRFNLLLHKG